MTPGVKAGAADVVDRLTSQNKACPNQQFALVGYSQGAAVMNVTAKSIPADIEKKIKALVMFGDPTLKPEAQVNTRFSPPLLTKLYENCEACDMVSFCQLFSGNC
jgi:cutinase